MNDSVTSVLGFLYAIAGILVCAVLWKWDYLSRKRTVIPLILTTLAGFILFSPIIPWQFQLLIIQIVTGEPLVVAAFIGLALFLLLTFLFGRIFCGYFCPVGVVQELASWILPWKWEVPDRRIPLVVRSVVFLGIIVLAFFSVSVLQTIGVGSFFHLSVSSLAFWIFVAIILLSIVVYRPFCRFICPIGVLFAPFSAKSRYAFVRTDACIKCGKCERVCPTDEAGADASKSECYMCGRCVEVCPVKGALIFKKRD